jgi:hypothetical protein
MFHLTINKTFNLVDNWILLVQMFGEYQNLSQDYLGNTFQQKSLFRTLTHSQHHKLCMHPNSIYCILKSIDVN